MVDTGIHKIHLFHTSDLLFYFSTNTKARWWILNPQNKWNVGSDAFIIAQNINHKRERGVLLKATLFILTKLRMIDPDHHWRTSTDFIVFLERDHSEHLNSKTNSVLIFEYCAVINLQAYCIPDSFFDNFI